MPSVAFAIPIRPGKADLLRQLARSRMDGVRKEAYESSRRRHGITREAVWIQSTANSEVAIIFIEADDLDATFAGLAASKNPVDIWFRALTREIHGIHIEEGFPLPEELFDYTVETVAA